MKYINDPQQNLLFDMAESEMSPVAFKRLQKSIYAVFHYMILKEMPALELGEHFDDLIGRPYSTCITGPL